LNAANAPESIVIIAVDPSVEAAREAPAIPSTVAAWADRLPFETRFACAMAKSLLD
jgi:hypothetical protein